MVEILKDVLGDALYTPPSTPSSEESHLGPSPESLKGKVLVKGKKAASLLEGFVLPADDDEVEEIGGLSKAFSLSRKHPKVSTKGNSDAVPRSSGKFGLSFRFGVSGKFDSKTSTKKGMSEISQKSKKGGFFSRFGMSGKDSASASSKKSGSSTKSKTISLSPRLDEDSSMLTKTPTVVEATEEELADADDGDDDGDHKKTQEHVCKELSEVVSFSGEKVKHFGSLEHSMSMPWGVCSSFVETKVAKKFMKASKIDGWIYYNQKHFRSVLYVHLRLLLLLIFLIYLLLYCYLFTLIAICNFVFFC